MSAPALAARALRVSGPGGETLVHDVDLDVRAGEVLAIVGASGAGKSLTALALIGLVPPPAWAEGGVVTLGGVPLPSDGEALRRARGARIGFVPQDPLAALDPVRRVGEQVAETLRAHVPMGRREARERARAALEEVGVARDDHPHRLSGGQRRRALIAMALVAKPSVLIADEPTASLDSAVQVGILDLIDRRRSEMGLAVILISHDIGAVSRRADRIVVMEGGRVVERGRARRVLAAPAHPVTRALLAPAAAPRPTRPSVPHGASGGPGPVLEARGLTRVFSPRRAAPVRALDDVDLTVGEGEAVALVGASGSGKTTLARLLVRLDTPTGGSALVGGVDVATARRERLAKVRQTVQILFQDPYLSLDPRLSVASTIAEPMAIHGAGGASWRERRTGRRERVAALLAAVGLDPGLGRRRPAQLSGGQRQRVALARALALGPRALVLDEPTSSLDAAGGARMMALLADLRADRGLAYLLISHDLAVVAAVADRVAVMHEGRIVEQGPPGRLLSDPRHPATAGLVAAAQELSAAPWAWPGSTTQA